MTQHLHSSLTRQDNGDLASVESLIELGRDRRRILVFTGAGMSTESGIPDYRGPGGVWATQKPPTEGDFRTNPETRRSYWAARKERFPELIAKQPNAGHLAVTRLFEAGLVTCVVTQNIDGLHQVAGVPDEAVVELHGSARSVRCLDCGREWDGLDIQRRQEAGEDVPDCQNCGGPLRAATVLFGEPLPAGAFRRAIAETERRDLLLVIGSSLIVQPAAKVPLIAIRRGIPLAIVNLTETPLDNQAAVLVRAPAGQVLPLLS
ncbi:MAG: NAD-dependent deacetylase, partial [Thermomicrobiales bacterium]